MTSHDGNGINRRQMAGLLGGLALTPLLGIPARADEDTIGKVSAAEGKAYARLTETRRLAPQSDILLGDLVWTAKQSRTSIGLEAGSNIHLGPESRLKIDRFVAETGGDLVLGDGAMVFDRDDDLPKTSLMFRTTFGLIGVRGTRFFAGPSKGVFGVFVERGAVRVFAGGAERWIPAGNGVDIAEPGAVPSPVRKWGDARIAAAFESVFG